MLSTPRPPTNRKPSVAAIVAGLLLTGCAPTGPGLVRDGERLIGQGRFADAVQKLEAASAMLQQNALVWNQLGLAYHGAGRAEDAARAYNRALLLNRDLYAARFNLGCLHLEQDNVVAAINELTTFTRVQPSAAEGWLKLATAQYRAKQFDSAERSLTHAPPREPATLNLAGMIQLARRRTREAVGYFEAALQAQPRHAPALLNLAVTEHQHLNNRGRALEKYRAYLALQPRPANWEAVQRVAQQLERELNPPPRPPVAAPVTAAPTQVVAKVVASVPTNAQPRTNPAVAVAVLHTNRLSPAVAAPETASNAPVARKDAAPKILVDRARAPVPASETQAVEVVRLPAAEPIQPAKDVPVAHRTPAPKAPGEKPGAPVGGGDAKPSAPSGERPGLLTRMNPVRWFTRSNPPTAPAKAPPEKKVAATRKKEPLPQSADPGLVKAAPQPEVEPPPMPRYQYVRPRALAKGNRPEAERSFARGVGLQRGGQLTQAITEYLAAVQSDPAYFEAHYNLGLAAFELGHLGRSLSAYEHALSINPTHRDARFNFALALQKANYPRDSANELEKLLAENPAEVRAHLTLANLQAQQLAQPAQARAHYLTVLELDPKHPQAGAIRQWLASHP